MSLAVWQAGEHCVEARRVPWLRAVRRKHPAQDPTRGVRFEAQLRDRASRLLRLHEPGDPEGEQKAQWVARAGVGAGYVVDESQALRERILAGLA